MAKITIQPLITTPSWHVEDGNDPTLRIASLNQFYASTGELALPIFGDGAGAFYVEVPLTLTNSGTVLNIPSIVIDSTSDSSLPVALYTATIWAQGRSVATLLQNFGVPATPSTTTWELLTLFTQFPMQLFATSPTDVQVRAWIDQAIGNLRTASVTQIGMTAISEDAVNPGFPIAISETDARVPTIDEAEALVGTDGTPSSSNPYVTDSDPRLNSIDVTNVTLPPYNADNTGATSVAVPIRAAISDGKKIIYLPAGIYRIAAADLNSLLNVFTLTGTGVEVFGDGVGNTIIQVDPSGITTGSYSSVFLLSGAQQRIHSLTFNGPTGATTQQTFAITVGNTATYPEIDHCEFTYEGITLARAFDFNDVNTTLGTNIAAGTRTVTPASMVGIYVNQLLFIDGIGEYVTVTDVTPTTFTAVFANAHISSDGVYDNCEARQYANVHDNHFHDIPRASAIVVNSSGSTYRNNVIKRVGTSTLEHGFYIQAGHNVFDGNWVEGIYGYSFHQHTASNPAVDESGNIYVNNTSLNPGTAHFQIDSSTANGSDPLLPNGVPTERYTTIANNVFKNTAQKGAGIGISAFAQGVLVIGNQFEDAGAFSQFWVRVSSYSKVIGNTFRKLQSGLSKAAYIVQALDASHVAISNNTFIDVETSGGGDCIGIANCSDVVVDGNTFKDVSNSGGIFGVFDGTTRTTISNNRGNAVGDNNSRLFRFFSLSASDNLDIYGNDLSTTADRGSFGVPTSARIHDNSFTTVTALFEATATLSADIQIWDDQGSLGTKYEMGRLLYLPTASTNAAISAGKLVALSGGNATGATTETTIAGIASYALGANSALNFLVAGQPNTIFDGATVDGAWVAGNYGVPNGTDGRLHDNGASPPVGGSSVLFLDSGGGAGDARVLVIRTLGAQTTVPVTFADGDTSPSVLLSTIFNASDTAPTTTTNFDDGVDGQEITIRAVTANRKYAQGATINNQTGADVTPAINTTISFLRIGGVWYQE